MGTERLEAFSDGVIAIIITIMVLDLKVPHGGDLAALGDLGSVFLCYLLSFIFVGIYWNNHHHLMHATRKITGLVLWANLHLLFWLSLIPFVTGWMGENHFAQWPVALYGFDLLMCGVAYYLLSRTLIRHRDENYELSRAVGHDRKGVISILLYIAGILMTFFNRWAACALYVSVATMWLVPDRRIEDQLPPKKP